MKKYIPYILIALSLVGFFDSLIIHFKIDSQINAPCIIFQGCDNVIFSQYSHLFGISLAYWGLGFYFVMFLLSLLYFVLRKKYLLEYFLFGAYGGFLFSIYLFYLEIMKIKSICSYCTVSFVTVILMCIFAHMVDKKTA